VISAPFDCNRNRQPGRAVHSVRPDCVYVRRSSGNGASVLRTEDVQALHRQQFSLWWPLETLSANFVGHFVEKSNMSQNSSTKCPDKVGDEDS
jgi:hypothetical protein